MDINERKERDISMTSAMIKTRLIDEINLIPARKLSEVYDFIHYFRLGAEKEEANIQNTSLSYAGSWQEMDADVYDDYLADIASRRKKAFSDRRNNETFAD